MQRLAGKKAGGEVLGDAVLHDFDRRRTEPAVREPRRTPLAQVRELLEPALAVPPQVADDPHHPVYAAEPTVDITYIA